MKSILKTALLALSMTVPVLTPAQAEMRPDWWLVLDDRSTEVAHFVDLASFDLSAGAAAVTTLIVHRDGHRQIESRTIDCERSLGTSADASIQAFICGSEDYRMNNGVNTGPVAPEESAAMLFGLPAPSKADAIGNFPMHGALSV